MKVSIPKEVAVGERRVALVPEVAKRLSPTGIELVVESGAGDAAMVSVAISGNTVTAKAWDDDVGAATETEVDVLCLVIGTP